MAKEMLINVSEGEECRIALVEDGVLEELYMERTSSTSHVGNVYKGKVMNVEASIQAAFIDFGLGRNGFLHISDLLPTYFGRKGDEVHEFVGKKMARRDRPPIQRCLRRGDEIMVQVIKEGIGTKGPTLSSYISISGKMLVMMPGVNGRGVSRKIEDEDERRRLKQILDSLDPPEDCGFIIRTESVGKSKAEIERDLKYLARLWEQIKKKRDGSAGPVEMYTEGDLVTRTVRDVFSADVDQIVIDNKEVTQRVKEVIKLSNPRAKNKVDLYEDPIPLFHKYGIEAEIEQMYSRHVPLRTGGSLVIDSTEAIVAIDVNSGKGNRENSDAEMTAFKTDMEAADEICRQLKLRDLGGVIIVDFIDLRYERHRRELEQRLHDNLKRDRAKTKVLRMSQFGIIEMTRQRMRPSLKRSVYFDCPHCKGAGLVKTPESMSLDVMRRLAIAIHDLKVARVELSVNPDVAFYLQNKKRPALTDLEYHTRKRILIRGDATLGLDEMRLDLFDNRDGVVIIPELTTTAIHLPHKTQLNTRPQQMPQRGQQRPGQRPPAPSHREREREEIDTDVQAMEDRADDYDRASEEDESDEFYAAAPTSGPARASESRPAARDAAETDENEDEDFADGEREAGDPDGEEEIGAGGSENGVAGEEAQEGDGTRRRRRRRRRRRGRGRGPDGAFLEGQAASEDEIGDEPRPIEEGVEAEAGERESEEVGVGEDDVVGEDEIVGDVRDEVRNEVRDEIREPSDVVDEEIEDREEDSDEDAAHEVMDDSEDDADEGDSEDDIEGRSEEVISDRNRDRVDTRPDLRGRDQYRNGALQPARGGSAPRRDDGGRNGDFDNRGRPQSQDNRDQHDARDSRAKQPPRDNRAPQPPRDDRGYQGPRDNRGQQGGRDDRGQPSSRDNRSQQGPRDNRGQSGPRGDRSQQGPRDDRGQQGGRDNRGQPVPRNDRNQHGSRDNRGSQPPRDNRGPQGPRDDRNPQGRRDQGPRDNRGDRNGPSEREFRDSRGFQPNRDDRSQRDARQDRGPSDSRNDRPAHDDREPFIPEDRGAEEVRDSAGAPAESRQEHRQERESHRERQQRESHEDREFEQELRDIQSGNADDSGSADDSDRVVEERAVEIEEAPGRAERVGEAFNESPEPMKHADAPSGPMAADEAPSESAVAEAAPERKPRTRPAPAKGRGRKKAGEAGPEAAPAAPKAKAKRPPAPRKGRAKAADTVAEEHATTESKSSPPSPAEPPVVRTGSADRHLVDEEPVLHEPVRRPRSRVDLDDIPEDYD